jgi:hypothetical protein
MSFYLPIYTDVDDPNLAESAISKASVGTCIGLMVVSLCLTFGLVSYFLLKIPNQRLSLRYVLLKDKYSKSSFCRIQNTTLFICLAILSIGAIAVASKEIRQQIKGLGGDNYKFLNSFDTRSANQRLEQSALLTFIAEFILGRPLPCHVCLRVRC